MDIPIAIAHAGWPPHLGGGGTAAWSENGLSAAVSALVSARVRELGCTPHLVGMPDRYLEPAGEVVFRCSGRHPKAQKCSRYNAGLRWCAAEARRLAGAGGVALSFHMGRGQPGWSGPLCLVNQGALAGRWATAYLEAWRVLSKGDRGRGVWELPRYAAMFPHNPLFVRGGPRTGSILIEMGNAASATDCALFDGGKKTTGRGLEMVAEAAAMATATILS